MLSEVQGHIPTQSQEHSTPPQISIPSSLSLESTTKLGGIDESMFEPEHATTSINKQRHLDAGRSSQSFQVQIPTHDLPEDVPAAYDIQSQVDPSSGNVNKRGVLGGRPTARLQDTIALPQNGAASDRNQPNPSARSTDEPNQQQYQDQRDRRRGQDESRQQERQDQRQDESRQQERQDQRERGMIGGRTIYSLEKRPDHAEYSAYEVEKEQAREETSQLWARYRRVEKKRRVGK